MQQMRQSLLTFDLRGHMKAFESHLNKTNALLNLQIELLMGNPELLFIPLQSSEYFISSSASTCGGNTMYVRRKLLCIYIL